jgi:2-polyprenyl-3-methyl-5-hydroxy-6-metoxy-1,4-benzoquinol methylase
MSNYTYVGQELDLFATATHWKAYYRRHLAPLIRGQVLEVGAGIGGTTRVLCDGTQQGWTCVEPDPLLAARLEQAARERPFRLPVEVRIGSLADLEPDRSFDTILYIDVLEHIEDDRAELERAAGRLRPGGALIVLCPAHQFLFTEFDRAVGHFRRYDRAMFRAISPAGLELRRLFYLDAVGMLLSLGNRLLLKSGSPTPAQIALWDRLFIPCSRVVDPLTFGRLGKSIVGVWRKA